MAEAEAEVRKEFVPSEVAAARAEDPEFAAVLERARAKARKDPDYVPAEERERNLQEGERKLEELIERFNAHGPAQLQVL